MRIGAILLLLAVGLSYHDETEFLTEAGFPHLVDSFRSEEIAMRMMHRLSNLELTELGLNTMGARIRFREAVESWVARDDPGEASEVRQDAAAEVPQDAAGEVHQDAATEVHQDAEVPEEIAPAVEEVEEVIENERDVIFYSKTLSTGRVVHYFLDHFYRFDRNKVKPNGRAYFQCSVRGCRAR